MSLTYEQARDAAFAIVQTAATAAGVTDVAWPGMPTPKRRAPTARWWRGIMRHTGGGQATLANHAGRRRWGRSGLLVIQVQEPAGGDGCTLAYRTAKILTDALEGVDTGDGLWFRNVRINEVTPDGNWSQVNVLAEFTYDEVK